MAGEGSSSRQVRQVYCYRTRSEEHTSELQSQSNLVCRLLLEKKTRHEVLVDLAALHLFQRDRESPVPPRPALALALDLVVYVLCLAVRRAADAQLRA